jgi:hypothetical protein
MPAAPGPGTVMLVSEAPNLLEWTRMAFQEIAVPDSSQQLTVPRRVRAYHA